MDSSSNRKLVHKLFNTHVSGCGSYIHITAHFYVILVVNTVDLSKICKEKMVDLFKYTGNRRRKKIAEN